MGCTLNWLITWTSLNDMTIRTQLTIAEVLSWADAFYERTGEWPSKGSGGVWEPPDEKWINIDMALRLGLRGFHRGQSLARLLAKHRGKRNRKALPKYTIAQILKWADSHHARVGHWPRRFDGPVTDAPGETWHAVDMAMRMGNRGQPSGSSLAKLLATRRGVRNNKGRPRLKVQHILRWADQHLQRTGNWPTDRSGPILHSAGETWRAVDKALRAGSRGLRSSSLAKLLQLHRGVPRHTRRPALTIQQILRWADAHHARTGKWPQNRSGPIKEAPGESWKGVEVAMQLGRRGLPGGVSLDQLLVKERGARNHLNLPPLTEAKILSWARAYKRTHGSWPNRNSGPIAGAQGETWGGVWLALYRGRRKLKQRTTLKRLIDKHH